MSAIFGFTGPSDRTLADRIAETLRHRARFLMIDHGEAATLGRLGERETDAADKRSSGLLVSREDDLAVVAAGYFLSPRPKERSIVEELLAQYRRRGIGLVDSLRGAFVLAIRDGKTLWTQPLPSSLVPWGLAVDRDGRVIVTLEGGQVLCFG